MSNAKGCRYLLIALVVWSVAGGLTPVKQHRRTALTIRGALLLIFAGYYIAYLTSQRELQWHLGTSCSRLLIQLWPAMLLLIFTATSEPVTGRVGIGCRVAQKGS